MGSESSESGIDGHEGGKHETEDTDEMNWKNERTRKLWERQKEKYCCGEN